MNMDISILGSQMKADEIKLVKIGVKKACRIAIEPHARIRLEHILNSMKLKFCYSSFSIVQKPDIGKGGFSNIGMRSTSEGVKYIYISRHSDIAKQARKHDETDSREFGSILGYPKCCIDFFEKNKNSQKQLDLVIPIKQNSRRFHYLNNICLRYFDISPLSHFPCSFDCKRSIEESKRRQEIIGNKIKLLKSFVIYTEYDGVFALYGFKSDGNMIRYKNFFYTKKNNIYYILKDHELLRYADEKIVVGKYSIENVHPMLFEDG